MLSYLLDFLFPKDSLVSEIERFTPYELQLKAKKSAIQEANISALFSYHDRYIEKALWELKYHANVNMARLFAPLLYESIIAELSDEAFFGSSEKVLITSIPPSALRLSKRHFDQGALLLQALEREVEPNHFIFRPQLLKRVKETGQQSLIKNRSERLANMHQAFGTNPDYDLKGKTIIVIDDITTTGATLSEARRALLGSGARRVYCLAIAH